MQCEVIWFSIAIGLNATACIFVGNKIGKIDVSGARATFRRIAVYGLIVIVSSLAIFLLVRGHFFGIFTKDTEVLELAMNASIIQALGLAPDHWQFMCSGAIKALGL